MTKTIRVVALFIAKEGCDKQVLDLLESLIAPTRREKGCLQYELHQSTTNPRDIAFIEEWTSEEDLDRHLASSHILALGPNIHPLIAGAPDIRRYVLLK